MKLYLNKASPYARLALVVAHEKGLAEALELVWVDPWTSSPEFLAVAPLGRVPVLVTDDGAAIADSAAICDYLDALGKTRALVPPLAARSRTLHKYGLGRGIVELAFGSTIEKRFHPDSQPLGQRWGENIMRAAQFLETRTSRLDADQPDLGDLCISVGLAYTDFRLPQVGWRRSCPQLAAWQDCMLARQSLVATAPE
jgi:glutathione S-transferase